MATITNRPTKLVIKNLEYPGFISFTGNDSAVGETGLVQFQATIEIAHHPGNPQPLNSRQNRFWCFGKKVEIWVLNAEKKWVLHPRGRVWIYKHFYDLQSRILNLETGCLIYLLKNRSITDFQEPESLVNVTEEKIDPETDQTIILEKNKYWWEQWNKSGVVDVDDIVSEVLKKLKLQKVGQAIGKIRGPWQPSGSLLQACGELVFKSIAPSYLWCDRDGKIRVERCFARQGRSNVAYTPSGNSATSPGLLWENLPAYEDPSDIEIIIGGDGGDEINYTPFDPGEEPIKELVITGNWKAPSEVETLEGGGYFKCFPYLDYGPESLVFPNGDPLNEIEIAKGERCEYFYRGKKVVFEWREEKRRLVFPDTRWKFEQWVRVLEKEFVQKFDPLNEDRLYSETETTKEPIGKVFQSWFNNHPDRVVANIDKATTTYSDALAHDKGLTVSIKNVTTYQYHVDLSLKEQKNVVVAFK